MSFFHSFSEEVVFFTLAAVIWVFFILSMRLLTSEAYAARNLSVAKLLTRQKSTRLGRVLLYVMIAAIANYCEWKAVATLLYAFAAYTFVFHFLVKPTFKVNDSAAKY